jgi:hypothetical protein
MRSDGSVEWEACTSYCFGSAPVSTTELSFSATNLQISLPMAGPLTYTVFAGASGFDACVSSGGLASGSGSACGTVQQICSLAAGALGPCMLTVTADSVYLVMRESAGFMPNFAEVYDGVQPLIVDSKMVPIMAPGQTRVLLRWPHVDDMDLWIIDSSNSNDRVGWSLTLSLLTISPLLFSYFSLVSSLIVLSLCFLPIFQTELKPSR